MKGFCIWFSGVPSAGKTTLAVAFKKRLENEFGLPATILDGDEIRRLMAEDNDKWKQKVPKEVAEFLS